MTNYYYLFLVRNSELQEQLWQVSIEKVKDWLSPDILEKYGQRGNIIEENSTNSVTLQAK